VQGFTYAWSAAHGLIAMGAKKILVIGTDTLARITDWTDRNTAILFADGRAQWCSRPSSRPGQLLGWDLDADGSAEKFLYSEVGGFIQMEGKEVFRRAVRIMVDSATKSHERTPASRPTSIGLVVPHQANIRIIQASCDRLGLPMEKAAIVLDRTGNTSSASIPLAFADALDNGRVQPGDLVLLVGFGAGMTAASAVIRWGGV
jgi:3-oxoacyl-[acyl-carrier-protein] synthase-3